MTLDPFRYQTRGDVQAANERRYRRWRLRWLIRWSAAAVPPLTPGRTLRDMTLPIDPRDDQARIPQQTSSAYAEPAPADSLAAPTRRQSRRWLWIALAVAVVLVAAGAGTFFALRPTDEDTAVDRCQTAITAKLKAPSTAKYGDKVTVTSSDGDFGSYYQVFGTIDAQNGFGAMIRGAYHCKVTHENDGGWLVTESSVTNS